MRTCRVCGERKDEIEFFKLKHFYKWNKSNVVWCRTCQRLFMDMKEEEARQRQFQDIKLCHLVTFD